MGCTESQEEVVAQKIYFAEQARKLREQQWVHVKKFNLTDVVKRMPLKHNLDQLAAVSIDILIAAGYTKEQAIIHRANILQYEQWYRARRQIRTVQEKIAYDRKIMTMRQMLWMAMDDLKRRSQIQ